jgi:hypothetical protein
VANGAFDHTARQWLKSHFGGDDRCPRCADRQWRISDPSYPIIQFTCGRCGRIVRTDLTAVENADGSGQGAGGRLAQESDPPEPPENPTARP